MNKPLRKHHRILVVEDAKLIRLMLAELFSEQFEVLATDSGEHVMNMVIQKKPVLILLDIMLRGTVDGFSLLRMLKKDPSLQHIPVIIISSLDEPEFIEKGLKLGANDYITKPFDLKILESKVANLVQLSEAIQSAHLAGRIASSQEMGGHKDLFTAFESMIEDMIVNESSLSVKQIAAKLNLSLSTFERSVKKAYGLTPNKYITYRKLEKARLLIRNTDMPIKQVAYMLGFNSVSYFGKCFKDRFKELPSKQR
jgi:DNA-binding response OmpR family regulator